MKEMLQRLPEGHDADSSADSYAEDTNNILDQSLDESHITNTITPEIESSSTTANRTLPNGAKTQSGKAERVVQDEPGVYITLSALPSGGNELKRVRFRYLYFAILKFLKCIKTLSHAFIVSSFYSKFSCPILDLFPCHRSFVL